VAVGVGVAVGVEVVAVGGGGLPLTNGRSASIASMSNPISFAKASSSHHSSGGFGIEVSPEP
jgi:hypothetical protein